MHSGMRLGVFVVLLLATSITGCRSVDPAVRRSEKTADLLADTRKTMVDLDQTVVQSQTSLSALSGSKGDLRPAFQVYLSNLDAVKKQADRVKRESEHVRNETELYCSARQMDVGTIGNEEMRQLALQRTARVKERCETIKDRYDQVHTAFARYIHMLSDLQTYLGNELNGGSITTGKKWLDDALESGEMLRGEIRALSFEIELTSNLVSPIPVAASKWPEMPEPPIAEKPHSPAIAEATR